MKYDFDIPSDRGRLDNWIADHLLPKLRTIVPDPTLHGEADLERMSMRRAATSNHGREQVWICERYNVAFSWHRWGDNGRWYPTIYMIPTTNEGDDYRKRWSILFDSSPHHHHRRGIHIEHTRDRILPWLEGAVTTVRYSRDRQPRMPGPRSYPDSTASLLTRPMSLARWYYEQGLFAPQRMEKLARMVTLSDMTEDYVEDVFNRRLDDHLLGVFLDQQHHDRPCHCSPPIAPPREPLVSKIGDMHDYPSDRYGPDGWLKWPRGAPWGRLLVRVRCVDDRPVQGAMSDG